VDFFGDVQRFTIRLSNHFLQIHYVVVQFVCEFFLKVDDIAHFIVVYGDDVFVGTKQHIDLILQLFVIFFREFAYPQNLFSVGFYE
jgi:hypothetical protein